MPQLSALSVVRDSGRLFAVSCGRRVPAFGRAE